METISGCANLLAVQSKGTINCWRKLDSFLFRSPAV
jgi:hypothetical protein